MQNSHFSQLMQEKNRSSSHFSQRTEVLTAKLGLLLRDLPDIIGISSRMFYGYRSGKYAITDKAWRKLEAAEHIAGIKTATNDPKGSLEESTSKVNEATHADHEKKTEDISVRVSQLETQVKILSAAVASMLPHGRKNLDEHGRK